MSFSYRYSFVVDLRPSTPPELLDWLEHAIAGDPCEPAFEVAEIATEGLDEVTWLLGVAGDLQVTGSGPDGVSHLLAVQHPNIHDDMVGSLYGLPLLLAPFAFDGILAVMWTDMAPDFKLETFYAQDGIAFVGGGDGPPVAAVMDPEDAPAWRGE